MIRRRVLPAAALLAAALALGGCTDTLFMHPDHALHYNPDDAGVRYETVHFPSGDGTRLAGIFFPSETKPARGTVVHFHGNAQNVTEHFPYSYWLAAEGFNVLIFDYRGFGGSQGRRDIHGAIEDGIAALKYVASRPDVDPDKILVFGQSLGAEIAVGAVARSGLPGIKAVALEGVFYTYRSIARRKLAAHWLTWPLQAILPAMLITRKDAAADYVQDLPRVPLLFIQEKDDRTVPYAEGLELYEKARKPKELWTVPGNHLMAFSVFHKLYRPKLADFFRKALEPGAPAPTDAPSQSP